MRDEGKRETEREGGGKPIMIRSRTVVIKGTVTVPEATEYGYPKRNTKTKKEKQK